MAIEISQLRKHYAGPDGSRVPIIDIEQFHLADGEEVALTGSSGSGKTTLLHLIAGILTPDEGKIVFNVGPGESVDIARLTEARRDVFRGRHLGYIFQAHHLLPGFTALENVLLGMSFSGRQPEAAWARHLLEEVGLGERLHYPPAKLSVGQQQRVAVARALANRPKVVLADEPTGSLDAANAQQVLELIRRLCREVSAALLLVSHDARLTAQLGRTVELAAINRPRENFPVRS
jgi:putative ABC transport system ATP-binding protein